MTVLNKEMKENRRVELTIRVERQEWQRALDDAYQANRDLYPVDGCARARPPARPWSRRMPRTCSIRRR